jgi:hypothetical protein
MSDIPLFLIILYFIGNTKIRWGMLTDRNLIQVFKMMKPRGRFTINIGGLNIASTRTSGNPSILKLIQSTITFWD